MQLIESKLEYEFNDKAILRQALTHPSAPEVQQGEQKDYETLEFLGDTVLCLVITEWLLETYPNESEGNLAKRRAGLVCRETIGDIAQSLQLGDDLIMNEGEINAGGRDNISNLENMMEAIIGGMYLDGTMAVVKPFIQKHWHSYIHQSRLPSDPKTELQEYLQHLGFQVPTYRLVSKEGPAHSPVFTVEVTAKRGGPQQGKGRTKRIAEREAAQKLLAQLRASND